MAGKPEPAPDSESTRSARLAARPPDRDRLRAVSSSRPSTEAGRQMPAIEQIRNNVKARLAELDREIESLREALRALDEQERQAAERDRNAVGPDDPTARPRKPAARPRKPASRSGKPARAKAKTKDGFSPELERLLAETGGTTAVELARQTGTDYAEVLERIRELERAGAVRNG